MPYSRPNLIIYRLNFENISNSFRAMREQHMDRQTYIHRSFECGSNSPSLKLGLYILFGYLSLFRGFDLSATGLISRLQVEGRRAVMPSLCFCIPSGHSKYWLSLFSEGRVSRLVGQGGRSWPVYTPRPLALGHEINLKCFFIIF